MPLIPVMQAAYVEKLGPPEEIRVSELPVPVPTDVFVAVELVAANPVDAFVRSDCCPTALPFSCAFVAQLGGAATPVNDMLVDGELTARINEILPLTATAEVHARFEADQVRGRVLPRP